MNQSTTNPVAMSIIFTTTTTTLWFKKTPPPSYSSECSFSTYWPISITRTGADGRTWRTTVWQYLPLLTSDTYRSYSPLAPEYCQYQEQGQRWGWGVSWEQVHSSGTVYQPPCEPQLSPNWRSLDIWRPTYSADRQRVWGPFMTRSINLLISIIINIWHTVYW